jgi:hypothetical protein
VHATPLAMVTHAQLAMLRAMGIRVAHATIPAMVIPPVRLATIPVMGTCPAPVTQPVITIG